MNNEKSMMIYHSNEDMEVFTDEQCYILEIMNDNNHEDVSFARARVKAGVKTALHALKGTKEFYYILSGGGEIVVNEQKKPVGVGDCIVIPAGCSQCIENTMDEDLIFLCICLPRFKIENYSDLEMQSNDE